jgi:hypothetical protein
VQEISTPAATPARKIVRFQSHNRRRWDLEKSVLRTDDRAPFVCECTSDDCLQPVELTMYEFEAAHMSPNWCAVQPGHILPDDGGRVIIREPHFWVVELPSCQEA